MHCLELLVGPHIKSNKCQFGNKTCINYACNNDTISNWKLHQFFSSFSTPKHKSTSANIWQHSWTKSCQIWATLFPSRCNTKQGFLQRIIFCYNRYGCRSLRHLKHLEQDHRATILGILTFTVWVIVYCYCGIFTNDWKTDKWGLIFEAIAVVRCKGVRYYRDVRF